MENVLCGWKRNNTFFSNFYSKQKKEDWKEVKVFAEDILEAKLKIKEMGLEHFKFERILIHYEKIK